MTQPTPGTAVRLSPLVRCVLAPNPSPMTYWGTNSYLIGNGDVAVLDPGPADPSHFNALQNALNAGERISHILVSHAHLDHSEGVPQLAAATGAPIYAFGDATAGRTELMRRLSSLGRLKGGEGLDVGFACDEALADGDVLSGGDWSVEAIWTPGHFGNHLCFALPAEGAVFSADLVMGWATSLVSPPDGDLSAFMGSLDRLIRRPEAEIYYSGHGAPIPSPKHRVQELIDHRRSRHAQIREALAISPASPAELAAAIYQDIPPALLPAAARNVFAHLIAMTEDGEAKHESDLAFDSVYRLQEGL